MSRSVEEIKINIAMAERNRNQSWGYNPERRIETLNNELRAALTASIPLDRLEAICEAERAGRCVVLSDDLIIAMNAGAYAIEKGNRHRGPTYAMWSREEQVEMPFGKAAEILRRTANKMTRAEAEAMKGANE
jgi:hypothetical protein